MEDETLQGNCLENKFVRINFTFSIFTNRIVIAFHTSFSWISPLTFHFSQNISKGFVANSVRILHQQQAVLNLCAVLETGGCYHVCDHCDRLSLRFSGLKYVFLNLVNRLFKK